MCPPSSAIRASSRSSGNSARPATSLPISVAPPSIVEHMFDIMTAAEDGTGPANPPPPAQARPQPTARQPRETDHQDTLPAVALAARAPDDESRSATHSTVVRRAPAQALQLASASLRIHTSATRCGGGFRRAAPARDGQGRLEPAAQALQGQLAVARLASGVLCDGADDRAAAGGDPSLVLVGQGAR